MNNDEEIKKPNNEFAEKIIQIIIRAYRKKNCNAIQRLDLMLDDLKKEMEELDV